MLVETRNDSKLGTHLIYFRVPLHNNRCRANIKLLHYVQILTAKEEEGAVPSLLRPPCPSHNMFVIGTEYCVCGRVQRWSP